MDKPVRLLIIILLTLFFISCSSQDVEIKLTVYNKSGMTLDSIMIHDLFENETKYYNIKPDTTIVKIYREKRSKIPKGERGVFSLVAFKDDSFYYYGDGFIGFPGTTLEDEYKLYIYDKYIIDEKTSKRKATNWNKLSEYPKE